MVKVKFSLYDNSIDIIDDGFVYDAEFRQFIFKALRLKLNDTIRRLNELKIPKTDNRWCIEIQKVLNIIDNNRFKIKTFTVKNGVIINEYEFIGDE